MESRSPVIAAAPTPPGMEPSSGPSAAGLWLTLRAVAGDIKLAHSVFALPFAVLGAFLARPRAGPWGVFVGQLALIVACMVIARTWAMVVNRLADARLDARNPRTVRRAFASGRVPFRSGVVVLVACNVLFLGGAALFWVFFKNPWPLVLAEPVLLWIAFYSFTKRFTWLCHAFLGGALAASPIAAALAVDPASLGSTPALWWLAGMVLVWVAGFDVIYALQDVEIDRAEKLWSVPSRLGVPAAIWISRGLHVVALGCLAAAWRAEARFGPIFGVAVALAAGLLIAEHVVLAQRGKAGLDMAFFTLNGIVSCVLGILGCVDVVR